MNRFEDLLIVTAKFLRRLNFERSNSAVPGPVNRRSWAWGLLLIAGWCGTSGCRAEHTVPIVQTTTGGRSETTESPGDADEDGLNDAQEDFLAERFAPIVFHGERETTYPTNVDVWLAS